MTSLRCCHCCSARLILFIVACCSAPSSIKRLDCCNYRMFNMKGWPYESSGVLLVPMRCTCPGRQPRAAMRIMLAFTPNKHIGKVQARHS